MGSMRKKRKAYRKEFPYWEPTLISEHINSVAGIPKDKLQARIDRAIKHLQDSMATWLEYARTQPSCYGAFGDDLPDAS